MMRTLILASIVAAVAGGGSVAYAQDYGSEPLYEDEYYDDYYDRDDDYYERSDRPEFRMFGELHYYGRWSHHPHYGTIWRPFVRVGWRPFMNGHWMWTNFGWMWASYEPFGWATYHYGYWDYDFRLGWIWIPDYEWSPSRVQWVVYDDYVCWAPMAPRGVHFGHPWSRTRFNVWVSVPVYHFTDHNVGRNNVRVKYKSDYAMKSVVRSGPERQFVERSGGRPIRETPVEFKRVDKGGHELRRAVLPRTEEKVVERYRKDAPPRPRTIERNRVEAPEKLRSTERPRIEAPQRSKAPAGKSGEVKRSGGESSKQTPAAKEQRSTKEKSKSSSKKSGKNPRDR